MPVTLKGFAELGAQLGHAAGDIHGMDDRATRKAAMRAKELATAAISPKTLSHWGRGARKGYTVKARYDVLGAGEARLTPTVKPLAALLTTGSGTVWKAPRRRGTPRRKKGSVGTYTRAAVPARGAWTKAEAVVVERWPHDYEVAFNAELRRIIPDFSKVL